MKLACGLVALWLVAGAEAFAANPAPAAHGVDCAAAMKKALGQQTQAEYDTYTKPALQRALCDAVLQAARNHGCDQAGTQDPRCAQLAGVLAACVRGGDSTGPTAAAPARR